MVDRSVFDDEICLFETMAEKYNSDSFITSINQLRQCRDSFDIKVMFVGHFSAGKSALINALIGGEQLLTENQSPETAIATELHYDSDYKVFAVSKEGNQIPISGNTNELDKSQLSHIEYYIDRPILNELSDFTIVDTPGFDSGIEAHNNALVSYLGYASAYIIVIDVEKGGIDKSSLRFINEICQYTNMISVIINKCEMYTQENVALIKESAIRTLQVYGHNFPVYCTSKYDDGISELLCSIIKEFNAQQLFECQLRRKICAEACNSISILNIIRKTTNFSAFDFDVDIKKYTQTKEMIQSEFDQKRNKSEDKINQLTFDIIESIRAGLLSKSDVVAESALSGGSAGMEAIICETIRPILINQLKQFSSRELDDLSHSIDFESIFDSVSSDNLSNIVLNLAKDSKELIDSGVFEKIAEEFSKKSQAKSKGKSIYHAISGIAAIVTNVISPVLEIIIVFLPDLIQLFGKIFGENDKEKIAKVYRNSIVPQITNKLYEPISQAASDSYHSLLDSMQTAIEEKIETINNLLQETADKKATAEEDYNKLISNIDSDLLALNSIIEIGEKNEHI